MCMFVYGYLFGGCSYEVVIGFLEKFVDIVLFLVLWVFFGIFGLDVNDI